MSVTTEKLSSNKVKLSFNLTAEAFDEAMQKAYHKIKGRVNVPGFRRGKAPRKLIESMYGETIFYDEAFDALFPEAYRAAIEEHDLHPVDQPEVDVQQIGTGKELQFTAEVFVMPDVTLGNYRKLSAVKHLHPVSEKQIEHRISHDIEKATTENEVTDRAVQSGDIVKIDYAGSVDSVPFEGGTADDQRLEIGSGSFIPGFEDQVIGMTVGEEKDIQVTFPTEYHAEDLAGKEAVFHIKLHSITEKVKPELDDEFAADVSAYTTFAEYRESIVKELTEQRDQQSETALENELLQQAVDQADCDIPDAMIKDEVNSLLRNMQMRMAYQGLRFEDYLKYTGQSEDEVRDMLRADAQNNVKTQLVMDALISAEKIETSQEDVDEQIERHAKEIGREVEDYKKTLNERQLDYYQELAKARKVIEVLKINADITLHEGDEHEGDDLNAQDILDQVVEALPVEEEVVKEETPEAAPKKATRKKKAEPDQE